MGVPTVSAVKHISRASGTVVVKRPNFTLTAMSSVREFFSSSCLMMSRMDWAMDISCTWFTSSGSLQHNPLRLRCVK